MNNIGIKSVVAVSFLAAVAFLARAEEVPADSAGVAAQRWLRGDAALGCPLGLEVDSVRTCSTQADASFHVVKLKGGGFVVMSSDTTREPVVAFSSGGDLVESDANPLWVLLKNDLALRMGKNAATNRKTGLLRATSDGSSSSGNEAKWNRLLGKTRGFFARRKAYPPFPISASPRSLSRGGARQTSAASFVTTTILQTTMRAVALRRWAPR